MTQTGMLGHEQVQEQSKKSNFILRIRQARNQNNGCEIKAMPDSHLLDRRVNPGSKAAELPDASDACERRTAFVQIATHSL